MVRPVALAALATFATLGATPALADPPGMTPVEPPGMTPETVAPPPAALGTTGIPSYRAQTLAADGLALVLLASAIGSYDGESMAKLSLGTYLLGAPLVHAYHGRIDTAVASVAMRVGLPLIGGMLGEASHQQSKCIDYCDYEEDSGDSAALGILGGVIAAMVIDTAYFARSDEVKRPPPSWSPTATSTPGGFAVGVSGSF